MIMMMAVYDEVVKPHNADHLASGLRGQCSMIQELVSAIETEDINNLNLADRISKIEHNLKRIRKAV